MAAAIYRTLGLNFVARTSNATKGIDKMKSKVSSFTSFMSNARNVIAAAGISVAIVKVAQNIKHTINQADDLESTMKTLGASSPQLFKGAQFAFEQANGLIESLTTGMKTLAKTMVSPTKTARESIQALGLDIKKLSGESLEKQFISIVSALEKIKDPGKRLGIALKLFKGAGMDIARVAAAGDFTKNMGRGAILNSNWTPELLSKADRFNDLLGENSTLWSNISAKIATISLDPLIAAMTKFVALTETAAQVTGLIGGVNPTAELQHFMKLQSDRKILVDNLAEGEKLLRIRQMMERAGNMAQPGGTSAADIEKWIVAQRAAIDANAEQMTKFRATMRSTAVKNYDREKGLLSERLSKMGADGATKAARSIQGPQGFLRGSAESASAQARFFNNRSGISLQIREQQRANVLLQNIDRNITGIRNQTSQPAEVGIN